MKDDRWITIKQCLIRMEASGIPPVTYGCFQVWCKKWAEEFGTTLVKKFGSENSRWYINSREFDDYLRLGKNAYKKKKKSTRSGS